MPLLCSKSNHNVHLFDLLEIPPVTQCSWLVSFFCLLIGCSVSQTSENHTKTPNTGSGDDLIWLSTSIVDDNLPWTFRLLRIPVTRVDSHSISIVIWSIAASWGAVVVVVFGRHIVGGFWLLLVRSWRRRRWRGSVDGLVGGRWGLGRSVVSEDRQGCYSFWCVVWKDDGVFDGSWQRGALGQAPYWQV